MMIKQTINLRNTQYAIRKTNKGAALLIVLFVIMAITIVSLGFLSRSDVELACGENMTLRTDMDYLADSGLEHAKGLILNPQDVAGEYWAGGDGQQLETGSSDFYNVTVVRDPADHCNYTIDCNAYRLKSGEQIGRSSLSAQLRLDPVIALWTGGNTIFWPGVTVNGDVRCVGTLINQGTINGDVFASSPPDVTGRTGQLNPQTLSLTWPGITVNDFRYKTGVSYYSSSHILTGNISINEMLLISGDLTVTGTNNVIIARKNLPALFVTGDLIIENGASLQITGLAVVGNRVLINGDAGNLNIIGGLFIQKMLFETTIDSSGNGNTGILYNGPTWQTGHTAGCLQFDGIDDFVQTSDNSTKLQLVNDYTLSVWIKPNATQKVWAGIVSKTNSSGSTNHWTLQFDNSSSRRLIIYHPAGRWETGINLSDVAGAWHHVTVVRNGFTMLFYLDPADGLPRKTTPIWLPLPGNGYGHLNIGADMTASSSYVYKGLIDDVRVYNQALDPNAVKRIYSGLPDPNNIPIGHWKMDESGSNVTVTAAPEKSAVLLGSDGKQRWGQAAGAFFKSIQRQ